MDFALILLHDCSAALEISQTFFTELKAKTTLAWGRSCCSARYCNPIIMAATLAVSSPMPGPANSSSVSCTGSGCSSGKTVSVCAKNKSICTGLRLAETFTDYIGCIIYSSLHWKTGTHLKGIEPVFDIRGFLLFLVRRSGNFCEYFDKFCIGRKKYDQDKIP